MRAIRHLCLAPIILATAATIAAGPAHQSGPAAQAASLHVSYDCPAGSNWDNVQQRCV